MTARHADLAPPRAGRAGPWLWCLWALSCIAVLMVAAALLASRISLTDSRQFRGSFEPLRSAVDIMLPAGIPVSELLVGEGDQVIVGQRLARLDASRLQQQIARLNLNLLLSATKRDCLLNRDSLREEDLPDMDLPGETQLALQTVLRDCHLIHRRNLLLRTRLIETRDTLKARAGLALRGLGADAAVPGNAPAQARALRLALESQRLDSALRQLDLELAATTIDQDVEILKQVSALQDQTATMQARLAILEPHLVNPWLIAPENGQIKRLRPLSGQSSFAADIALLRLKTRDRRVFEARADLPALQSAPLRTGDHVAIRLSGLALTMPAIDGVIAAVDDSPGTAAQQRMTRVTVHIAPSGIQDPFLRDAVSTLLSTGQGRSTIRLSPARMSLLERLGRAVQSLSPKVFDPRQPPKPDPTL